MKIRSISIRNFRRIDDISFDLKRDLAVIVGPNAVGKTTVFEALRLAKAMLIPRASDEAIQVMVNLGASSPNVRFGPFQYDFSSLAGDTSRPVEIRIGFTLDKDDVKRVKDNLPLVAQQIAAARIGQNLDQGRLDLMQYFSSAAGRANFETAQREATQRLSALQNKPTLELSLTITEPQMVGNSSEIDQAFLMILERTIHPFKAMFSYFPADRAMPQGEVAIQLSSGDMKQQVDSHLAAPANKYARLKQVILNELILAGFDKKPVEENFNSILAYFLPGKTLKGFEQRPTGLLRVNINDEKSGRTFDIDGLSSGEKGLLLTFMLIRTGLAKGGIVLLDEPELHLHPSLCNRILPFLEESAEKIGLQILFTTHSPDLLRSALDSDKCEGFHLRSPNDISPMYTSDRTESLEALRLLGVSAAESFLSRAFVFVEGEDDKDILSAGFSEVLLTCSISGLGGRGEVEKYVKQLQKAESADELDKVHLFIFDHDRKTTGLKTSKFVLIEQLDRYCIENYLLEPELLLKIVRQFRKKDAQTVTIGDLNRAIAESWDQQLREIVVGEAYGAVQNISCAVNLGEWRFKPFADIGSYLAEQLRDTDKRLHLVLNDKWESEFIDRCNTLYADKRPQWAKEWKTVASGKEIYKALQQAFEIGPINRVKVEMAREMQRGQTPDWSELNGRLVKHLASIG